MPLKSDYVCQQNVTNDLSVFSDRSQLKLSCPKNRFLLFCNKIKKRGQNTSVFQTQLNGAAQASIYLEETDW